MTDRARITHWICTGQNRFETNYEGHKALGSASIGFEGDYTDAGSPGNSSHQDSEPAHFESSHSENSTTNSRDELLIGCDGDPLIPTAEDINRTYLKGQRVWQTFVDEALSYPSGYMPISCLDLSIMMQNVPPLPENLQGEQRITGQSMWYVPCPELSCRGQVDLDQDSQTADKVWTPATAPSEEEWDPQHVYGALKHFNLWVLQPTKFSMSFRKNVFRHFTSDIEPAEDDPSGLTICTICWSYILSVRLLEMQRKSTKYSSAALVPVLVGDLNPQPHDIVINLGSASTELVRWICTLLASKSRWLTQRSPPWAMVYEGDYRFVITTTSLHSWEENYKSPSSTEAAQLLIEFGVLYNIESQLIGGFISALMLPVHNIMNLNPRLPIPKSMEPSNAQAGRFAAVEGRVLNYLCNIARYMTLSIQPVSFSSAIWSIFWEPGVDCNLVSAWLGSIHQTIDPMLKAGDLEMLGKVFALYRPRLAPIWLGIAILGCPEFINMIESYLTTLEERPFFCRMSRPDIDVAAWTGSPQSFLDEEGSGCYMKDGEMHLLRSDLVRLRFNYRFLSDTSETLPFGWQPFGSVRKRDIEPELQDRVQELPHRKLLRWSWYTKKGKFEHCFSSKQQDTGKTPNTYSLVRHCVVKTKRTSRVIKLYPSRVATWRIMEYGLRTASGDVDSMEHITEHKWLNGLR